MKYITILVLTLAVFCSCSGSGKKNDGLSRDIAELNSAPEEIRFSNKSFSLEAYVWRDLMPSIDSSFNRGLIAAIKVKTVDSSEIPPSLKAGMIWILNKDSVWQTKPGQTNLLTPDILAIDVSGGPDWNTGTIINIIIEIKYEKEVKLLGLKNQEVHAVY